MTTRSATFVVTIPVRGICLRPESFGRHEIESRPWVIVGPAQFKELTLETASDSLLGNLNHIWERLAPSSLLLVRYGDEERQSAWDERRAERVLAALNLLLLLTVDLTQGRERASPRPVFRARYREYCDLPLAFDLAGVRSVGHTGRLGLLTGDEPFQISLDDFHRMVASGSSVIQKILGGGEFDNRDRRLIDGMTGILGAFDTLTTGAFVSHLVGVAEAMVDSHVASEDGPTTWKRRTARIKVLTGRAHTTAVDRVLRCRHEYVHGAGQPQIDGLAYVAFAVAVQVWGTLATLYNQFPAHEDVERILDAATIAEATTSVAESVFSQIRNSIPAGPKDNRLWIRAWLDSESA